MIYLERGEDGQESTGRQTGLTTLQRRDSGRISFPPPLPPRGQRDEPGRQGCLERYLRKAGTLHHRPGTTGRRRAGTTGRRRLWTTGRRRAGTTGCPGPGCLVVPARRRFQTSTSRALCCIIHIYIWRV